RMPGPRACPPVNRSGLVEETLAGDIEKRGLPVKRKRTFGARLSYRALDTPNRNGHLGHLTDSWLGGSGMRQNQQRVLRVTRFSLSALFAGATLLLALTGAA